MTDWFKNAMDALGYWGVALLTFAENLFPPIPSEVIMPLAGFTASQGQMDVGVAIAAGTAGSLFGSSLYYFAGLAVDEERLASWVRKHGKWMGLGADDLDKAKSWFDRHGRWALLICRFVPGVRTLISLPAGLNRTPPATFFAYSAVGIAIWTTALTYAGVALGENYKKIETYVSPIAWAVFVILAGALALYIRRRRGDDREAEGG